jgi:branched-subunit amino acid aminotransferase/4-amino-4-deoxychorismate lyase
MPESMIYVNGKIVPKSEANVNVFEERVTHGWAAYKGIRVYEGRILELFIF